MEVIRNKRRIIFVNYNIKEGASAIVKSWFGSCAKSVNIEPVGITAIRFIFHSVLPKSFDIIDEFALLTFCVSLAANDNNHIFKVASCLLNSINRDGRVRVFSVIWIPRAEGEPNALLGAYIPIRICILGRLRNCIVVLLLTWSRADIRIALRAVAVELSQERILLSLQ